MMGQMEPMKGHGFYLRFVKGLTMSQVRVEHVRGDVVDGDDTVEVDWMDSRK